MAEAYLESCRQRAITDLEAMALEKENQRLAEAIQQSEVKIRGREEKLMQLEATEAAARMELQQTEDRRKASEVGL